MDFCAAGFAGAGDRRTSSARAGRGRSKRPSPGPIRYTVSDDASACGSTAADHQQLDRPRATENRATIALTAGQRTPSGSTSTERRQRHRAAAVEPASIPKAVVPTVRPFRNEDLARLRLRPSRLRLARWHCLLFRRLTAENLTQDHEFSAVKTARGDCWLVEA